MIYRNLKDYASNKWSEYITTVSEVSKSSINSSSLVNSGKEVYNFDEISNFINSGIKQKPTSTDAILLTNKSIELIEFKSGFKKKITKDRLDPEKSKCERINAFCDEYWKLFFKNQDNETTELIKNIMFKAIESYITLEKNVLPLCEKSTSKTSLNLIIVIDENEIDSYEDTLLELTLKQTDVDNCFTNIRNSLRRFISRKDSNGDDYFYDNIEVLSSNDYLNKLNA